jgi:hypothetical protein
VPVQERADDEAANRFFIILPVLHTGFWPAVREGRPSSEKTV